MDQNVHPSTLGISGLEEGTSLGERKGCPCPVLAACKHRVQGRRDWACLTPDIASAIAELLLAEDVVDYMSFRAVCAPWRASTASPHDPTLRDVRFRPRSWIALCDGDGVRPTDAGEITFFHTSTSRRLRIRLHDLLQFHRVVGFTDGLVILLNKITTTVRVLHPFTRIFLDLPPLASVFWLYVRDMYSMAWMNAAVCLSHTSIAVVVWFPNASGVFCSEPGHLRWTMLHKSLMLWTALPFQGRLIGVKKFSRKVVQVYPPSSQRVLATIPKELSYPVVCYNHLIESGGRAILLIRQPITDEWSSGEWVPYRFALFDVNISGRTLTPLSSLGDDRALFVGKDRSISVSAKDLPSIYGNSIYISRAITSVPVIYHSQSNGTFEGMSTSTFFPQQSEETTGHTMRPFALSDHLVTYCNHTEWARGLMFHEFYQSSLPRNMLMKLGAQDNEVQIPLSTRHIGVNYAASSRGEDK